LTQKGASPRRLRVSIIDYLNALPLNLAFRDGRMDDRFEITWDFPSQCADNMAAGAADVGLISSIEYQRIAGLAVARGVSIASRQQVKSVLIVSKRPFQAIQTIAVDRFSRSSEALTRVLFQMKRGHVPRMFTMSPDCERMLRRADAALIIGDAALRSDPSSHRVYDLAQLWYQDTGLPFVFAFWAIGPVAERQAVAGWLREAKQYGMAHYPQRLAEFARRWSMPQEVIAAYLRDNVRYELGEQEVRSLKLFYRYACEANLIGHVRPIELV